MPRKFKILLVEDDEDERFFMKEGFTSTGLFDIIADAGNGEELLALINKADFSLPEIILSDLNMPGKNGYDILSEIRNKPCLSHIPVFIVSTASCSHSAEKCKRLGAHSFFTKPDTFLEYDQFAQALYNTVINEAVYN